MEKKSHIPSNNSENHFFIEGKSYIASKTDSTDGNSKEIQLPSSIFRNGLSGLEAITKYLNENLNMRYCDIARLLNRDDRTIWDAHNSARKKSSGQEAPEPSEHTIPLSVFRSRILSVLESAVSYFKEDMNMRNCRIATLLGKDSRTVWTVYHRAVKKRKNGQPA